MTVNPPNHDSSSSNWMLIDCWFNSPAVWILHEQLPKIPSRTLSGLWLCFFFFNWFSWWKITEKSPNLSSSKKHMVRHFTDQSHQKWQNWDELNWYRIYIYNIHYAVYKLYNIHIHIHIHIHIDIYAWGNTPKLWSKTKTLRCCDLHSADLTWQ